MRKTVGFWTVLLAAASLEPSLAVAAEDQGPERFSDVQDIASEPLPVLQNRKYGQTNELALFVGIYPADSYYKGLAATAGYTLHFSDGIAWEIAQFTWSFNFDSDLKTKVIRLALSNSDTPPEFPEVRWMVASHVVFKPLYGKQAFFNTNVVHLEGFLQAGPAFLARANTAGGFAYGLDLGLGVRLWMTRVVSLRLDVGELLYIVPASSQKPTAVAQALHLHLGCGFAFGAD